MKKLILMMLMSLLLMGCKSKKLIKEREISKEIQKSELKKDSTTVNEIVQEKDSVAKTEKKETTRDQETEITVKGKVDKDNPLTLHDIKNGDTLQSILISGNADVIITSKNKTLDHKKSESESKSISDKLKDFSQNIVDENNLDERFSDMKKKAKDVHITDTSTGIYLVSAILGAIAIIMFFVFLYFKRKN